MISIGYIASFGVLLAVALATPIQSEYIKDFTFLQRTACAIVVGQILQYRF